MARMVPPLGGPEVSTPRYQRVLRPNDGIQPTLKCHRKGEEQTPYLAEPPESLAKVRFAADEIVALSPRAEGGCSTLLGTTARSLRLCPIVQWRRIHSVSYRTIRALKDLEGPAVVVTESRQIRRPASRALLYVAATRPLKRLVVLAHDRVCAEVVGILRRPVAAPSEVQRHD